MNLDYEIEEFTLKDKDFVECYWLNKNKANKNIFVIFHGLEGSFLSPYIQGIMKALKDKNYLRKNFKLIFLNSSPKESLKLISGDLMASIFVSSQSKKDIKNEASKLIEERNQWTKSDLDVKSFLKEGWGNFLIFFEKTYKESNLSEEERGKAEMFYAFVYTYIKKGFVIPTKNEVLIDEILKKEFPLVFDFLRFQHNKK